jgi:hypothetical protein
MKELNENEVMKDELLKIKEMKKHVPISHI